MSEQTIKVLGPPTVTVRREVDIDPDPDLSWLGEYTSSPTNDSHPVAIDRKARGDHRQGEYTFFHGGANYSVGGKFCDPVAEGLAYVEQDYQRMEAYNRGEWWMVGVIATAVLETEAGPIEEVASLWGIESDSDEDFFVEVEKEQMGEAVWMLGLEN